ncbi:MAG: pyruvate, water dikinase regulatory protein [Bacillota bacterium]
MLKEFTIFILSDSIGDTAEQVARATAEQYNNTDYEIRKFPYVESREKVDEICQEIDPENSIVVYTMVNEEISNYFRNKCKKQKVTFIDIMSPCLKKFTKFIGSKPSRESGIIRQLDENYFKRVKAVEFAVKYDDGKDPRGILKADIVLIGVSRSSKTPLSMYLAHKNYKVVNIPLFKEAKLPQQLYKIPKRKIIGLTIEPSNLVEIRRERIRALGLQDNVDYVSINKILEELNYSENVMHKLGCAVINMTNKAVEEAANIIIDIINDLN